MRFFTASSMAYAVVASAALVGAVPASAQNVDAGNPYFDHAEGTMSTNAATAAAPSSSSSYLATHKQYMQMDPRDAKASAEQNADAGNPYFDHAEGTMGTNAGAVAQSEQSSNGQYVAAYHQPYMQMDPRDAKADANASQDVDGSNIYFNHAKGTMSGN